MRPPKPPTGGQAVTAQLIVVSIWAAGRGQKSAEAGAPEVSRSSDLSEETRAGLPSPHRRPSGDSPAHRHEHVSCW